MRKIIIAVVSLALSSSILLVNERPDGLLHVYFLNVGQGDSFMILTPSGEHILIDGGPGRAVLSELSAVLPFFNTKIDYVLLTHPDRDHIEGLISVLKRYPVEHVFFTGVYKNDWLSKSFFRVIRDKKISLTLADSSSDFTTDDGVLVDILFPFHSRIQMQQITNNSSMMAKVVYGENEILFTGDGEEPEEEKLVKAHVNLAADVLKVPHHGSKTSSSEAFLKRIHPRYAVISVGKNNSYHHPHPSTMKRLRDFGIKVIRTDQEGRVEFIFDLKGIHTIKTQASS